MPTDRDRETARRIIDDDNIFVPVEWAPPDIDYDKLEEAIAAALAAERETLLHALRDWLDVERARIGAVDGYDYRSGEEYGLRRAAIEVGRRARGDQ